MRTASRRVGVIFFLVVQISLLLFYHPPVGFAEDTPVQETTEAPNAASALGVAHGAHLRPVFIDYHNGTWYSYGDEVMAYDNLIGKDLAIVMYFAPWAPFDPFLLNDILKKVPENRRPVIALTWGPDPNNGTCPYDGQDPLSTISSGRCDDYIRRFARAMKARPERFILRFAHEMNITDTPWWPGHYGLDAGAYVQMFRRVRSIFRSEGAVNVEFMWSPNYASNPGDGWNAIWNYYPGDDNVDWIGLSGYNWGAGSGVPWRDFTWLYDSVLRELACRYAKPVIISEIGSVQGSGETDKANWIIDAYRRLPGYPFVRGVIWFNDFAVANHNAPDFRVTTGTGDCNEYGGCTGVQPLSGFGGSQATNAYINSVRGTVYTNKLPSLAEATPPNTICSGSTPALSLSQNVVSLKPGQTASVTVRTFMYSAQAQVTLELPAGIHGAASPTTLPPPSGMSTITLTASSNLGLGVYKGIIRVGPQSVPITIMNLKPRAYLPSVRH